MWYGLICFMVLYLFLVAGLSREHVNAILTIQQQILTLFKQEEYLTTEEDSDSAASSLPADIRTVLRNLDLEPFIRRAVCCPRCFEQYVLEACPAMCSKRQTTKSKACATPLLRRNNTPYRFYNTQSMKSWLQYFVNRQDILRELETCRKSSAVRQCLQDVQESPQWHAFAGKLAYGNS